MQIENDQTLYPKFDADFCSIDIQIAEIIGLFVYHFFSCWVLLSVLHWIRRGRSEPSNEFMNLITTTLRQPNAIVSNHTR